MASQAGLVLKWLKPTSFHKSWIIYGGNLNLTFYLNCLYIKPYVPEEGGVETLGKVPGAFCKWISDKTPQKVKG